MTKKWDDSNKHRYSSICVKYKKEFDKDVQVIENFKKTNGETYLEKIKNLLDYYKNKIKR